MPASPTAAATLDPEIAAGFQQLAENDAVITADKAAVAGTTAALASAQTADTNARAKLGRDVTAGNAFLDDLITRLRTRYTATTDPTPAPPGPVPEGGA